MPLRKAEPLVSVIVPMFNSVRTIRRALASVFKQSYSNFQVVVVDDGSSDGCAEIVRTSFGAAHLVSQANLGASAARNLAARVSEGDFLAFLDADDQWHTRKLELQIAALARFPEAAICATQPLIQEPGQDWHFQPDAPIDSDIQTEMLSFERLFASPYLGTPTVVMPRHVFESCGGFDEQLHGAEDVDLWLRAAYGRTVIRLRSALVGVGRSADSLSARRGDQGDLDNLRVIEKFVRNNPEFWVRSAAVVRGARSSVKTRLGSNMLSRGDYVAARRILVEALRDNPVSGRALYLLLKTWLPYRHHEA